MGMLWKIQKICSTMGTKNFEIDEEMSKVYQMYQSEKSPIFDSQKSTKTTRKLHIMSQLYAVKVCQLFCNTRYMAMFACKHANSIEGSKYESTASLLHSTVNTEQAGRVSLNTWWCCKLWILSMNRRIFLVSWWLISLNIKIFLVSVYKSRVSQCIAM